MKKFALTLLLLLGLLSSIRSQTVDSIKIEQAGELIKIRYMILNSNAYQVFRVTVFCSINGGLKSELKSLSGDFGDNVVGGRSEYMVLWDVLKDVDEVNSVDFSVRAELLQDDTPITENKVGNKSNWENEKFYLMPCDGWGEGGEGKQFANTVGMRLAYMGNWGGSAKLLVGKDDFDELPKTSVTFAAIDLTKRIISQGAFQLHLMAGVEYAKLLVKYNGEGHHFDNFLTYEIGITLAIGRFVMPVSFSHYNPSLDNGYTLSSNYYFTTGVGIRF